MIMVHPAEAVQFIPEVVSVGEGSHYMTVGGEEGVFEEEDALLLVDLPNLHEFHVFLPFM